MARTVTPLHQGWTFAQAPHANDAARDFAVTEFRPVAQFPTNVHLDLLEHGLIPDPFIGKNENLVQWIGEREWVYKTTFVSPKLSKKSVIVFEGLDTYATVVVNGKEVLKSENMFTEFRVDVTDVLKSEGGENSIEIRFESAFLRGKEVKESMPDHHWGCWNGDSSRLAVRKAQYHYGWDWGPTLLTTGPWKPVYLETYEARISDIRYDIDVPESLKDVKIVATAEVEGSAQNVKFEVSLDGNVVETAEVNVKNGVAKAEIEVKNPQLWYPVRYGKQPLYTVKAVLDEGVDEVVKRVGLRRLRLVQRPLVDAPGTTFFFEVNNVPIWVGGSNWIPADNFIPRISNQKYRDWLELLVEGGQVMARVWAGGIYEHDIFYDTADELGILVWQDFGFGCGNYPTTPSLLASIEGEAISNLRRLRHHPSLAILAGNNEDYQYQESIPLDYDPTDLDPESWLTTSFPARYIYEKLLPDACATHCPGVSYHPGSPLGGKGVGSATTTDPTRGDLHQWNVWHQQQLPYQDFDKLSGRFVSEFGMEAFPHVRTLDSYLAGPADPERHAQSGTVDFHNKADGHERRIALYMVENFRFSYAPLEGYVHATQLMQSECLSTAYRLWRREWKGRGREYNGGALVWQINDCWPVTSWAIVDYYLRPKAAFWGIKRELADFTVGAKRSVRERRGDKWTRVDIERTEQLEVWVGSFVLEGREVEVRARSFVAGTGEVLREGVLADGVFTLEGNLSREVTVLDVKDWAGAEKDLNQVVFAVYLHDVKTGEQLARRVDWAQPLKYVYTSPRVEDVSIEVSEDKTRVRLRARVPVKGLVLEETGDEEAKWEDQGVDLVPGETVEVGVKGLKGGVKGWWYGLQ
ncbi:glycoside hydrolase [Ascobolus immersus RN42]|uniref:Beta-mannosidase B n=1 Tax=Ascobolus immersus RN42 TaxID=1160509 RepID=A0A3N4HCV5_ASCIM|nr:glycoside hydrolase [Ascobolus immersus RN42]